MRADRIAPDRSRHPISEMISRNMYAKDRCLMAELLM